jgi:hypothetical protein
LLTEKVFDDETLVAFSDKWIVIERYAVGLQMAKCQRDKTVAEHSNFLPKAIIKPRQFEQVSSRGQWFVEPNAATRVNCLLGCAGQSSVASASCSCLAAEKNMTLAQAARTVASTVASLEKIRSSDNEWIQIWKEVGQLQRVAEIRADVAQPATLYARK